MPPESGRLERMKGVQQAESIRDQERAGRPKIHVLDGDWNTNNEWWKHFGGKQSVGWIKSPYGGGQDENYWLDKTAQITLYRCSDSSGKLTVEKIKTGHPDAKQLDTNDCFIVDADAEGGIYVWVGKNCTQNERKNAMDWARQFLEKQMRPKWTQVVRVLEGAEPEAFTQWFGNWNEAKKPVQHQPKLFQVSNESGKLHVEEIADFYQEDLDGDDVMILDGINIIYVWVGTGANKDEKDHAKETAQIYLEASSVARHKKTTIDIVFQGKEPPTFKKFFRAWDDKLFQGLFKAAAIFFDQVDFNIEEIPQEQHGTFFEGDSYIILSTKEDNKYDVHFWLGRGTSQDEMATAALKVTDLDLILHNLPVQYRELQNHESALFLSYFKNGIKYLTGGNATGKTHEINLDKFEPRLFQCNGKRNVRCTQVKLVKESLNLGDVFILDLGREILIWMPPESGRLERIKGMQHAKAIRDSERGGNVKTTVLDNDWNSSTEW
uniref:Gelsolin-like domain-containing protein n=1 Tax=Panagrolaimus davidi TaxID=227884 RepID=A0A914R103_9BILA